MGEEKNEGAPAGSGRARRKGADMRIEYDGVGYASAKECCEAAGVSYGAVMVAAKRRGTKVEEEIRARAGKGPFVYKGRKWKSRNACCVAHGVRYADVKARAGRDGASFAEALDEAIASRPSKKKERFEYGGVTWRDEGACCAAYGVKKEDVDALAKKLGAGARQALDAMAADGTAVPPEDPAACRGACFAARGESFSSVSEACARFGVYYPNVTSLMAGGASAEEAFEALLSKKEATAHERAVTFGGVTYPSLAAACRGAGLPYQAVRAEAKALGSAGEALAAAAKRKEIAEKTPRGRN